MMNSHEIPMFDDQVPMIFRQADGRGIFIHRGRDKVGWAADTSGKWVDFNSTFQRWIYMFFFFKYIFYWNWYSNILIIVYYSIL